MRNTGVWNETTREQLRKWWEQSGYTLGRISDEFAAIGWTINKNQIIGKVWRMKLKPPEWKAKVLREHSARTIAISNIVCHLRPGVRTPNRHVYIRGKKYKAVPSKEIIVTDIPKVGSSKAVLLKHSKEGQCKAIIGYVHGKLENAVYCGEDTLLLKNGVHAPWCPKHHAKYTTEGRPR